jgi:hypothetical protein
MAPDPDFCRSSLQCPKSVRDRIAVRLQINSHRYIIFKLTHIGPKQYIRNIILHANGQYYHFLSVLRDDQKQCFFAHFEKFTKNEITNTHDINIPSDRS